MVRNYECYHFGSRRMEVQTRRFGTKKMGRTNNRIGIHISTNVVDGHVKGKKMKHVFVLPITMIIVMLSITSMTPLALLFWSGVTLIGGLSVEVITEDTYIFEERTNGL